ncbi:hypothetical protein REPUB_Repub08aG0025700 [Reevesia pubescens]
MDLPRIPISEKKCTAFTCNFPSELIGGPAAKAINLLDWCWDVVRDEDEYDKFIVRQGVPGFYMYSILERQEHFSDAHMFQIRIAFKLKEDK